jgi:hypothetical protein
MWTLSPENAEELQRPLHITKKTMATVFFNGKGTHMIDALPQNPKMNTE